MYKKIYIPGYYLLISRLKTKGEKLSFFIVFPGFIFYLLVMFSDRNVEALFSPFLFAFLAWLSAYEIGYLENDVITVRKEKFPNYRISRELAREIFFNFKELTLGKYLISVILLMVITLFGISYMSVLIFVFCIIATRICFTLHNFIRSKWNIATYFSLSFFKYTSFLILFREFISLDLFPALIISVVLLFPIPRTFEHATKGKYGLLKWQRFIGKHDNFRVYYFTLYFLISLLIFFVLRNDYARLFLISGLYFLIYRVSLYILLHLKIYNR